MALPGYQQFMLPVILCLKDGAPLKIRDLAIAVADHMSLTPADRTERLDSGQEKWYSRFNWAVTYLYQAKAIDRVSRGVYQSNDRGRALLAKHPAGIDNAVLAQFPEFNAYLDASQSAPTSPALKATEPVTKELSPDERLDAAFGQLRTALAADLLGRVRAADPAFFEKVVVDLLVAMRYGGTRDDAAQVKGGSGDGGIDGTIKQDKLGLDTVYVQAKRWQSAVGRPELQGFAGSLGGEKASKGVFVTTSTFTPQAREFVGRSDKRIVLIDGQMLAELMIEHGVGVSADRTLIVNKIDGDYFDE